jgi:hypothetical protein
LVDYINRSGYHPISSLFPFAAGSRIEPSCIIKNEQEMPMNENCESSELSMRLIFSHILRGRMEYSRHIGRYMIYQQYEMKMLLPMQP